MADMIDTNRNGKGNPFAVDYSKLGKTMSGRAWLEKAIHPPGSAIGPVRGMPDNEAYPSTVLEYRNTQTISTPNPADPTWNLLVLALPNAEVPYLFWRWSSSQPTPTLLTIPEEFDNPNYNFNNWDEDVSRWRQLYGSITAELNAPALSDQGMVYCAQQRLELTESVLREASTAGRSLRPAQCVIIEQLPTQPNVLQQISPGFYKQRAKEGCFTTLGLCQPTNLYAPGTDVATFFGDTASFQTGAGIWSIGSRLESWEGAPTRRVQTGVSDNWSASWVLFQGVSNAGTIELKDIHGYEMQASFGSSFALFVQPSAPPDPDAVDAYYALRHGMQDGYPASYNLFGSLLAGLGSLVPKIVSWLAPVGRAALPALGQAVSNLGNPTSTPTISDVRPSTPVPKPRTGRAAPGQGPKVDTSVLDALKRLENKLANLETRTRGGPVAAPRKKRKS